VDDVKNVCVWVCGYVKWDATNVLDVKAAEEKTRLCSAADTSFPTATLRRSPARATSLMRSGR